MAKSRDHLDHLCDRIGIAPANSEEEVQAAQEIAEVFESRGLEATVQDFDAPAASSLFAGVTMVVAFLGVVLAGTQVSPLGGIGVVLALAAAALLVARQFGYDLLGSIGPRARSQNVIALHEACGPKVERGNRPIVVFAHYDTPREDLLSREPLASVQVLVRTLVPVLVPASAVLSLFQLLGFVPPVARRVVWVVAILAALPVLLRGVSLVSERFMACTDGANAAKSGVAAMLAVMDRVQQASEHPGEAPEAGEVPSEDQPTVSFEEVVEVEEVVGVRHGEEVLASLGILPSTCQVTYVEPEVVRRRVEVAPEPDSDATVAMDPGEFELEGTSASLPVPSAEEPLGDPDLGDAAEDDLEDGDQPTVATPGRGLRARLVSLFRRDAEDGSEAAEQDEAPEQVDEHEEPAAPAPDPDATVPATPADFAGADDPTSEAPAARPMGRRAALFDLADPARDAEDPLDATGDISLSDDLFAQEPEAPQRRVPRPTPLVNPYRARAAEPADAAPAGARQEQFDVISPSDLEASQQRKRRGLFGRKRRQEEESMSEWLGVSDDYDAKKDGRSIGSWDNFESDDDGWKGGAVANGSFRVIDGSAEEGESPDVPSAPDGDDLREATLSLGDEDLVAHDIYFVALGASELGNAGIKAFLDEHRRECRGAFVLNLTHVGAGRLTVLTEEGLDNRRKADRRLVRLIRDVARDVHVDLADATMRWGDTDATPAMRTSMRAATIVGIDEHGLPALGHSLADVAEELDADQIDDVCSIVTEVIRRS